MYDTKNESNTVGNLQKLKIHLVNFQMQRDQAQANFQQLVGAVLVCEMLIKDEEEKMKKFLKEKAEGKTCENQGAIDNGQTKCEGTEQVA